MSPYNTDNEHPDILVSYTLHLHKYWPDDCMSKYGWRNKDQIQTNHHQVANSCC